MMTDSIVDYQISLQSALASHTSTLIGEFSAVIAAARTRRAQVWLAGSGGSAMMASHYATDLLRCADLSVHVKSKKGNYGVIEDAHLAARHMVAEILRSGKVASSSLEDH